MATALNTGGGFGGFAPTPLAARKPGRVVRKTGIKDVDIPPLGDYDAPTTPQPSLTVFPGGGRTGGTHIAPGPRPRPTSSLVPDPSGARLVPSSLTGETLRSLPNSRYVRQNQDAAVETPMIASKGGKSPPITSDPNADWIGSDETGAWAQGDGPEAGTGGTRSDGLPTEPGMGDEPDLIAQQPSPSPTPSNEWTTSPGDRRFLPSPSTDPRYMANFGGNMTLGQFLSTPLAFLRFGENRGVAPGNVDLSAAGREAYVNQNAAAGAGADTSGFSGSAEGYTPPEVAAMSEEEKAAAFAAAERQGAAETAGTMGRTSSDPRSRFGNLNSPTGQAVYMDAQGNWRPVSGSPVDVRWDPANPHNSNFTASQTTQAYLAGGQQPGNPNSTATFATEGRFLTDEEGTPTMQGRMYGDRRNEFRGTQGGPTPYGNAASQLAFFNWQRQQPEYQAWLKKRGGG